ncbi:acyl-CoA dehydrogenase family protein [Nocardia sp. alder85J]|uniref:acyl-CoA dehydrogenase family protein n=1 Tax=Nocardia sp. alder85J TaxID=2862949 RepID=UPI001CD25754|nr:acyl-CoA dehydrogenase family protein [Nocardia sp. alder85J]MCX4095410.1 acyl-CoA/acyl-ACP dehydrogenase [Nocardia sp. alder85J]
MSAVPPGADVDLLYTDVEEALRASVRSVVSRKLSAPQVAALYDGGTVDPGLWRTLSAEVGLAGLLVPEQFGGAGATAREAAVVLEELGAAVAPVPFLTGAVVAVTALLAAGAGELAGAVAEGTIAALATPFTALTASPTVTVADDRLTGEIRSVAGALDAAVLLVPATAADGLRLYAVAAEQVSVAAVVSLDMSRPIADLTLAGAEGTLLATGDAARAAVDRALETGAALLASEQVGIAQWCLDTTVEYLKVRKQFGRVVGGFQAVKHRLADLFVQVESARAAARYAAATLAADDPDRSVAAALAQAYCADVAVLAAEEALQLHGGIGMTWEHPVHLYLKRAKADQLGYGSPAAHHARLAGLVDLPA